MRRCKICNNPITDRTRSKRCLECRLPDPRTCGPTVQVFGPKPANPRLMQTSAQAFMLWLDGLHAAGVFPFFPGIHQPGDAVFFALACISINRLWKRRKRVGNRRTRVIVDSGAFTEISTHGCWRSSVEKYARRLFELHTRGIVTIVTAEAQDYMCEPFILKKTGMTVAEHQRLTIERYDALVAELMRLFAVGRAEDLPFPVMPVLQGWHPADYVQHVRMYGDRLKPGMWVGVGSVCKRNSKVASVEDVLSAIKEVRPDLRLHGFRTEEHGAQEPTGASAPLDCRQHGLVVRRSTGQRADAARSQKRARPRGQIRRGQASLGRKGSCAARRERLARSSQIRPGGASPSRRRRAGAALAIRPPQSRMRTL